MNRRTLRKFDWNSLLALAALAILLPGLLIAAELSLILTIPATARTPALSLSLAESLFVTVPALFILFMIAEALGHIRDRNPPSDRFD